MISSCVMYTVENQVENHLEDEREAALSGGLLLGLLRIWGVILSQYWITKWNRIWNMPWTFRGLGGYIVVIQGFKGISTKRSTRGFLCT